MEMRLPIPIETLTLQSQVFNFHPFLRSSKGTQSLGRQYVPRTAHSFSILAWFSGMLAEHSDNVCSIQMGEGRGQPDSP